MNLDSQEHEFLHRGLSYGHNENRTMCYTNFDNYRPRISMYNILYNEYLPILSSSETFGEEKCQFPETSTH